MNRLAALLTCLLWAAPAGAQIAVPPTVPPHRPIVATIDVAGAAAGSVQVLWEADEATALEVIGDGGRVHCWAPPGEHWLRCNVFRVDWESRQFRVEQHRAAFRVDGATPGPDPPEPGPAPPPAPVGKLTAVIVHETEDDTPAAARLFVALRSGPAAKWLGDQGHKLLILDDDTVDADGQPLTLVAKLEQLGVQLPALFVLDEQDRVLLQQTLAEGTTADNVIELLRRAGG